MIDDPNYFEARNFINKELVLNMNFRNDNSLMHIKKIKNKIVNLSKYEKPRISIILTAYNEEKYDYSDIYV